jgi:NitT/TauT family transport system substrate-binding protein
MEDKLADPAFADKMVRFVRASQKGWQYAIEHPDEAAQIVIDNDESGAQTLDHQTYMMGEVAKLVDATDFKLDAAAYDRTEKALLDQKIITAKPSGAFTAAITDKL